MPTATRTFRVFVSSTFEDLKTERDALQREVFPKLRRLCEENNARFQAIDLRWGVRDEAALDQQTMEICLREIERCQQTGIKPNFIVLLGDRYGWRPLPARIEAVEFETVQGGIANADDRTLMASWFQRDDNAAPPEYVLKPRTSEWVEAERWQTLEARLHKILLDAAHGAALSAAALVKYEASATHQEILRGLGQSEEDGKHVFAFFRTPAEGTTEDPDLAGLKLHLLKKLPAENIHPFSAADFSKLCADVEVSLGAVIKAETGRFTSRPALDLEREAHDAFALDRVRHFTGRQSVLDTISDHIRRGESRPLVVHGPSGCGKSAIMAKAAVPDDAVLIRRFIGATPESSSGLSLLRSLCQQLSREYGISDETPIGFQPLVVVFHDRMARATAERPLVLFLDALDQLRSDDEAYSCTWLCQNLPPHVSLVVSTTGIPAGLTSAAQVTVEDFPAKEAEQVLAAWLADATRELQPEQRRKVLSGFAQSGLPLYLKLAFEESRRWRSFDAADRCALGNDVGGMIDVFFNRISAEANHGPILVNRSLSFLAAARYGLTEDEMLDVLTEDDAVWSDFDQRKHHDVSERRLPVVVWSRLSLDLESYFTERTAPGGTVISFFHRQLAERVAMRFLAGTEKQARHGDLVRHFSKKPAWFDEGRKVPNARKAAELVYQQLGAQQWTEAAATLLDCQFLFAKVAAGMVLDLDDDYEALLREAPAGSLPRTEALRLIHGALRLSMHVVAHDSSQFASQMVGRLLVFRDKPDVAEFVDEITAAAPRPWFRPLHPCFDPPGGALLLTLKGHANCVLGVAVTSDGKRAVSASGDNTLKVWDLDTGRALRTLEGHSHSVFDVAVTQDGKRAVSASDDKTLKVWDLDTGLVLHTLEGHSREVLGVAVTPDGAQAVSASDDKTLKVWDLDTGRIFRTLEGHSARVSGVAVTPDGKRAISASYDKTLKVWDLGTGRVLRTLQGHSERIEAVAVMPDGRRAVSASSDKTLKVWDLDTGRVLRTLEGHILSVEAVAVTLDGKRAVSASWNRTLKVWDLDTGRDLRTLEGHSGPVEGVALTPDGKRAVSASQDTTLKVWNLDTGETVRTLEAHSAPVSDVAVTPDGKRAVSASHDMTLRVWDVDTGHTLYTLEEGHLDPFRGVAVMPDGKRAVSSSRDMTVWDLETGRRLRRLNGHWDTVFDVAVTPDGKRAISASQDRTLKVWNLDTGEAVRTLEGHVGWVYCVAITQDGKRAVSASADKTLKVWDLDASEAVCTLEGHSHEVLGVAVTSDGKRAVSAPRGRTPKVWDLATGRELHTLNGHSAWVLGVAVTPDGKRAVSASRDRTLKVWDLDTGLLFATFHCDAEACCCTCADEQCIVAGDDAGRIYFLALEE